MKKLLSILSVLTITGTSLPSAIAARSYLNKNQNTETENKNYSKIRIQNLENELNNEIQQNLKYFFENNEDFILKNGNEKFNHKLKYMNKIINNYINHLTKKN